ncbi:putative uncharacterized protein ENSP00000383407 isoform X3 [Ovis canadensis]|uniref:putative uncharacterized protein ENSP00000383407 isoform X3 n=1 Tax=Ovis canadensis TaxID=37174 RepID=UPI0037536D74
MVCESLGLWQGFYSGVISWEHCPNSCEAKRGHCDKERKLTKMNLFCFSLEGSMDSLYEPVPEKQAHQERSSGRTDTFFSPSEDSGRSHSNLFMEVSNFENGKTKRKSIRRSMSESKVFEGKTVNDTIWQEPSKSENDSHIRRLSQLKDLNEDDFLSSHNAHTLQGKKLQGISYQVM